MRTYADLHIHSKYARACSPQLTPENIDLWCRIKGLGLVATGDFTHPKWLAELSEKLEPAGEGLYRLKKEYRQTDARFKPKTEVSPRFVCGTEVACIYRHNEKTRRVHHCVYAPSLEIVNKINQALEKRGAKLKSDGRPIIGMTSKDLLTLLLDIDEKNVLIPAHIWTPWFAIFGSKSGYNSVEECFEDLSAHIFALETGLSSDPTMNWQVSQLDKYSLVSHSDAHSLPNLGREADIFEGQINSYDDIWSAIKQGGKKSEATLWGTVEFFPDEGRYHYDGHRECGVSLSPQESSKLKGVCPKCRLPLTIGVLNRVEELSDRAEGIKPKNFKPFVSLIELDKIIAEAQGVKGRATKTVEAEYWRLISESGSEIGLLLDLPVLEIKKITTPMVAEAIQRLREGRIYSLIAGYDGEYGKVNLLAPDEIKKPEQKVLF